VPDQVTGFLEEVDQERTTVTARSTIKDDLNKQIEID